MWKIDTIIGFRGYGIERMLKFYLMHVDRDIGSSEVLEAPGVIQVKMSN